MTKLTDSSIIPFGKAHEGKRLIDVPSSYLKFIYEAKYNIPQDLKVYIEENWEEIKQAK